MSCTILPYVRVSCRFSHFQFWTSYEIVLWWGGRKKTSGTSNTETHSAPASSAIREAHFGWQSSAPACPFRSWQREIVIWGDGLVWFSIVFSINFSSFFHQSQLFCGGNSMGCDPEEPSTEYPSGGLLPNCSSNPFLLVIPHPRYGPKNL